jgi:hypothetical protein
MLEKLLLINPKSSKMILLLIPPIYGLWLLAVGKRLLKKMRKKDTTYTILSLLTIGLFTTCCIIPILFWCLNYNMNPKENGTEPILASTFICWFGTIAFLSKISVRFERKLNKNRYYNLVDFPDYIRRFFELLFWFYTIWTLQETFHDKYLKD